MKIKSVTQTLNNKGSPGPFIKRETGAAWTGSYILFTLFNKIS